MTGESTRGKQLTESTTQSALSVKEDSVNSAMPTPAKAASLCLYKDPSKLSLFALLPDYTLNRASKRGLDPKPLKTRSWS